MMKALLVAAILMTSALAGQAAVYKCSIADGVHAADRELRRKIAKASGHLQTSFIINTGTGSIEGRIASPLRPS